jgi:hypothetical protein
MRISNSSTSFCSILSSTCFMKMLMCALRLSRASAVLVMLSADVESIVEVLKPVESIGSASIFPIMVLQTCSGVAVRSQPCGATM